MATRKRCIVAALLLTAAAAWAAAEKISDLTTFGFAPILTEAGEEVWSEGEVAVYEEAAVALADDDLFTAYDVSIPATGYFQWQTLLARITYANIDGYVAGGHKDWTTDQGSANIAGVNIGNFPASLLTAYFVTTPRGGLRADVSAFAGLVGLAGSPLQGTEVNSKAELAAMLADVGELSEADGQTYSGTHDFTGANLLNVMPPAGKKAEEVWCDDVYHSCIYGDALLSTAMDFYENSFFFVRNVSGGVQKTFSLPVTPSAYVAAGDVKTVTLPDTVGAGGLKVLPSSFANGSYVVLDSQHDTAIFEYDGTSWFLVSLEGGTVH